MSISWMLDIVCDYLASCAFSVLAHRGTEQSRDRTGVYGRGPNASACNDEVVAGAHALHGFYDIFLVIWDDFDSLQLHAEGEAELG
jgi:hypothetical protein